jgi:phosphopantetheine adenylyltransferase/dephospho-CoA kinase
MVVIGLTGGIASGKSTAAELLQEFGAQVIDADRLGHRAYAPDSAFFEKVVNEFGHDIVGEDGEVNRQVLGGKVFGDPEQMQRLTNILWPAIRQLAKEEIAECKQRGVEVIVLEAAVMIEAGWQDLVDEVWVLSAKPALAIERLMSRNGLTADAAQSRIDSQITNKEREQYADVKIGNSGDIERFGKRVKTQWNKLQKRIAEPAGSSR